MSHDSLRPGTIIKLRRDTAANWTTDNPVLAEGETGWETDTRRVKLGDGVTDWVTLPYAADEAASVAAEQARAEAAEAVLGADIATEATDRAAAFTRTKSHRWGRKVSLLGASITYANGQSSLQANPGSNTYGYRTHGPFVWANAMLGQAFTIVENASVGGITSAQILDNLDTALEADPDIVLGHDWWINDLIAGTPLATIQDNINDIIDGANAAGALVVLTDYLPITALTTQAMVENFHRMIDWLADRQDHGFAFIPCTDGILDPSLGIPAAWATYDGTHPTPRGARAMGEQIATRLAFLLGVSNGRSPVSTNYYAGSGVMGNPRELIANPMFAGGTTVAPLFTLGGTGSPVGSKVAATDVNGLSWQRITFGADGTATLTVGILTGAGMSYAGPAGTLTLTPGTTRIKFGFEFRVPDVSNPAKWVNPTGYTYFTGSPDVVYALQETSNVGQEQGLPSDDNLIYTVESPARTIPAAATAVGAAIIVYGQAGAVVDFRRASLRVVD